MNIDSIAFQSGDHIRFHGAKVSVFVGRKLVTLLRDDVPHIVWPGHWDLPGGGRENDESPWDCAMRECREEVSLTLAKTDVLAARSYVTDKGVAWFFVARVPEERSAELLLGDEGAEMRLMTVDAYLTQPKAIPTLQKRLADWIAFA